MMIPAPDVEAHHSIGRGRCVQRGALGEPENLGVEAVRRLDVSNLQHKMIDRRLGCLACGHGDSLVSGPSSPTVKSSKARACSIAATDRCKMVRASALPRAG